jgi:hypothetical protein
LNSNLGLLPGIPRTWIPPHQAALVTQLHKEPNPTEPLSISKPMLDNMNSGTETNHLIAALFCLCLKAFHNVLSHTSPATVEAELYAEWKEERGRFILWGEGFSVENGELDTRLVDSREYELRRSVVVILSTMAHAFDRGEQHSAEIPWHD